jgi:hypothetical protein
MRIIKENLGLQSDNMPCSYVSLPVDLELSLKLEVRSRVPTSVEGSLPIHLRNARVMNAHAHDIYVNDVQAL